MKENSSESRSLGLALLVQNMDSLRVRFTLTRLLRLMYKVEMSV